MVAGVLARNDVTVRGNPAGRPMVFAHGFGCDVVVVVNVPSPPTA